MAATRFTRPAAAAAPVVLPGDVRLMNVVASSLFAAAALALVAAGVLWLARSPWFALRSIQVEGELLRITGETCVPTPRRA